MTNCWTHSSSGTNRWPNSCSSVEVRTLKGARPAFVIKCSLCQDAGPTVHDVYEIHDQSKDTLRLLDSNATRGASSHDVEELAHLYDCLDSNIMQPHSSASQLMTTAARAATGLTGLCCTTVGYMQDLSLANVSDIAPLNL